jgi:serine/threonine-protein kinase RsbT
MSVVTLVARNASFSLRSDTDIVAARRGVRDWAREIGLTVLELTKLVTAASELARNTVVHGGGGTMRLEEIRQSNRPGLRVIFRDAGRGIPDLDLAMQDGYSSGNGMGIGLPGAKRLVNEFSLASSPTEGTVVTIVRWKT